MLQEGMIRMRPAPGRSQARAGVAPLDPLTVAQVFEPLPVPLGTPPYHFDLETVVPGITAEAATLGKLVFHCVGDTGGVKSPQFQQSVAAAMDIDLELPDATRPRFFYHLGDVVYFNGQISDYYDQFYEPYSQYGAPIIAIPGNHDGDPIDAQQVSLDGWVRYFMQGTPAVQPESGDAPRVTLSLPNAYFTLVAPFVTIVGMYTNVPEGGSVDSVQQQWLTNEFRSAPVDKALIVALHHPIYSFDKYHSGSPAMADAVEKAINDSRRVPNMVLSAHVHDYQRIEKQVMPVVASSEITKKRAATRELESGQRKSQGEAHRNPAPTPATGLIPFLVAGNGGYYNLHQLGSPVGTTDPTTGARMLYGQDTNWGYMTLTVDSQTISGTTTTVPIAGATTTPAVDTFSYSATAIILPDRAMVDL